PEQTEPTGRRSERRLPIGDVCCDPSRGTQERAPADETGRLVTSFQVPKEASASRCPPSDNERPHSTGRSFFTSASEGSTAAPSTYLKSTIMGLPSFCASLPTYAPMVAWWSLPR